MNLERLMLESSSVEIFHHLISFQNRLVFSNINGNFLTSNFPTSRFFQLPFPNRCIPKLGFIPLIIQLLHFI